MRKAKRRKPSGARAKKEFLKREARRARLAGTWTQPKPGGWFSKLLGIVTASEVKEEK